ncbi:MAG: hypothetical protein FD161_4780 [Limisphaerales bacterium]|nr:MAG: hypothetical protein FD161_4780 [Limisphaerales bacterium]KAG0506640.1 MAG: hypothetical protein E1N63_4192 [Limisphaerales bacterium]TXT44528.1 MAG: hypothetical protein FD140_4849 [Limisphaerales bacterium]
MSEQLRTLPLWLPSYLRQQPAPLPDGVKDVMLCVCDHFEPLHRTDKAEALRRMAAWKTEFPKNIAPFRDADGIRPRHTCFYPIEQYDPDLLNEVAELCRASGAEVEVHLHHNRDTEETLRAKLEKGIADFTRHGFLSRDAAGRTRWGFVHGDWALDNSHPDGAQCGVSNELSLLRELGCFADFTLPSCPDATQTRTINRLYYAQDTPEPKSHDTGVQVRVLGSSSRREEAPSSNAECGTRNAESGQSLLTSAATRPVFGDLLIVQGPLALNWERRKLGFLPRLENSDLTAANPPRPDRMRLWLRQHIHVLGRPEWIFVKLHTHGGPPPNSGVFLGESYRAFHQHLAETYTEKNGWRLHYVTARELVNILHAAEDGHVGNAGQFRDYRYRLRA